SGLGSMRCSPNASRSCTSTLDRIWRSLSTACSERSPSAWSWSRRPSCTAGSVAGGRSPSSRRSRRRTPSTVFSASARPSDSGPRCARPSTCTGWRSTTGWALRFRAAARRNGRWPWPCRAPGSTARRCRPGTGPPTWRRRRNRRRPSAASALCSSGQGGAVRN
ncbi:MAG: hypothetical protein AVDCRST_MAG79-1083, partial [uncultured Thermoleophilia bacterium]